MSVLALFETITLHYRDEVEVPLSLPTVFDAAIDDPDPSTGTHPDDARWARHTIRLGANSQVGIRPNPTDESGRDRRLGRVGIQLFAQLELGDRELLELADAVEAAHRRKVLSGGIRFLVPETTNVGRPRDSDLWQVNVSCPFECDFVA